MQTSYYVLIGLGIGSFMSINSNRTTTDQVWPPMPDMQKPVPMPWLVYSDSGNRTFLKPGEVVVERVRCL